MKVLISENVRKMICQGTFPKLDSFRIRPTCVGGLAVKKQSCFFGTSNQSLYQSGLTNGRLHARQPTLTKVISQKRTLETSTNQQEHLASSLPSRWERVVQVTEPVYNYILSHTREPQVLTQLREETSTRTGSGMQIAPEQGQVLSMLVRLMGAERCVEVGVFTGYSAISVALALPEHGRLVAIDRAEETFSVAKRYFELAGVAHKIDVRLGQAKDKLEELLANGEAGSYDFAFLDADKMSYRDYYESLLQLVKPGGLVVVDNVLWHGAVVDQQVTDSRTDAMRQFNDFLVHDQRIDVSMMPIGDGMTLCRKR